MFFLPHGLLYSIVNSEENLHPIAVLKQTIMRNPSSTHINLGDSFTNAITTTTATTTNLKIFKEQIFGIKDIFSVQLKDILLAPKCLLRDQFNLALV